MTTTIDEIKSHNFLSKPPWAGYIWTDEHAIYIELPCPVGKAPVIVQYPITEGGLSKAISLITQCANIKRDPPPQGWFRHNQAPSKTPMKVVKPELVKQPQVLQDAVKRALRKAGML